MMRETKLPPRIFYEHCRAYTDRGGHLPASLPEPAGEVPMQQYLGFSEQALIRALTEQLDRQVAAMLEAERARIAAIRERNERWDGPPPGYTIDGELDLEFSDAEDPDGRRRSGRRRSSRRRRR